MPEICERKQGLISFRTPTDKISANKTCVTLGGVLTTQSLPTSPDCPAFWAPLSYNDSHWLSDSADLVQLDWMKNFPQKELNRKCAVMRSDHVLSIRRSLLNDNRSLTDAHTGAAGLLSLLFDPRSFDPNIPGS